MKNLGVLIVFLLTGWICKAMAAMELPRSFVYFDLEMPFRCQVDSVFEQNLTTMVPLEKQDFSVRLPFYTDQLPRFQVNGFSFRKQPLDKALVNLLYETDIQVESELEICPVLTATTLRGELSAVVEELTKQAGVFYSYEADRKTIVLKEKSQVIIQLPKNKQVMMSVVDALSGGKFNPIASDWLNYQITLNLTRSELDKVRSLMSSLVKDRYLLSAQISVYEVKPYSNVTHWQQILSDFGSKRVASSTSGTGGNLLVFNPLVDAFQLVEKVMNYDKVVPLAQGQMVIPSNWQVRFNLGECMLQTPYTNLSVLMNTSVKNSKAKTILTIDSKEGEVASFDFSNAVNQEAAIIGVPVPNMPDSELLLVVKFNFINLVKKGE